MSLFVPDEMYLAWFLIQNGKKEGSILIHLGQKVTFIFFLQFNIGIIFVIQFKIKK
jgi:hypothetical protein